MFTSLGIVHRNEVRVFMKHVLIADLARDQNTYAVSRFDCVPAEHQKSRSARQLPNKLRPPAIPKRSRNNVSPPFIERMIVEPVDSLVREWRVDLHSRPNLGRDNPRGIVNQTVSAELS